LIRRTAAARSTAGISSKPSSTGNTRPVLIISRVNRPDRAPNPA
jgi:hypothetical protein